MTSVKLINYSSSTADWNYSQISLFQAVKKTLKAMNGTLQRLLYSERPFRPVLSLLLILYSETFHVLSEMILPARILGRISIFYYLKVFSMA